jgi:hypothetical protein
VLLLFSLSERKPFKCSIHFYIGAINFAQMPRTLDVQIKFSSAAKSMGGVIPPATLSALACLFRKKRCALPFKSNLEEMPARARLSKTYASARQAARPIFR